MSQSPLELVRDAWGGGGGLSLEETAQAYWHPEIEYIEDPTWPGASRYRGRDEVLRCFRSYAEALGPAEDTVVTLERVVDAGERVVALVRFRGRSASGLPHDHLWAYLVEVWDGSVVRFQAFYDPEEAFGTAGVSDRQTLDRDVGRESPDRPEKP